MSSSLNVQAQSAAEASLIVSGDQGQLRPKRILHVLDHSLPLRSGYSIRSRSLIKGQRNAGLFPQAVTGPLHQVDDPGAEETIIDGVRYHRTPLTSAWQKQLLGARVPLLREMTVVRLLRERIVQLLKAEPFDIVHVHSPSLCGVAALGAAATQRIPVVYEIRAFWEDAAVDQGKLTAGSGRYVVSRRLEGYVARRAHAVVGIAKHILEDLRARGISSGKLFHVPNGVDTEYFTPSPRDAELAAKLGLADEPVLGFIGSLYRYEGLAWLVRAAAKLRATGASFQILIVGHGEEENDIRKAVRELRAQDYVRMIGEVSHDQVRQYYSLIDVMVYPRRSIRLTEITTPLKVLEAMAQAKPVLASNVGGIRELVGDETTCCLLFPPDDVEAFCEHAKRLIYDEHVRRELGEKGRKLVLREKDWNLQAHRYITVYDFAARIRQKET